MRDSTDFYCCDEMEQELEISDFSLKETIAMTGFNFCPFCGHKLSSLV